MSTTKKKAAPKKSEATTRKVTTWRVATILNPKTEREVTLIEIGVGGRLRPGGVARTGLEFVEEWFEVRASRRVEAVAKIAAGEGKKMRREGKAASSSRPRKAAKKPAATKGKK